MIKHGLEKDIQMEMPSEFIAAINEKKSFSLVENEHLYPVLKCNEETIWIMPELNYRAAFFFIDNLLEQMNYSLLEKEKARWVFKYP